MTDTEQDRWGELRWAVYTAAYAVLRAYENHPTKDRGLIQAGDHRIPNLIADDVVSRLVARSDGKQVGIANGDEPHIQAELLAALKEITGVLGSPILDRTAVEPAYRKAIAAITRAEASTPEIKGKG